MPRLIAVLVGSAFLSTWMPVSAMHVHRYADHDHAEHHHGLATHEHHGRLAHPADGMVSLHACDPADHLVSLEAVGVLPSDVLTIEAEIVTNPASQPDLVVRCTTAVPDARAHGPPGEGLIPTRAPPRTLPA